MGVGLSKRSNNGGVGRCHSWAAQQNTPPSLYKSLGGSFNQLQCLMHEFGSNHTCRSENYLKQKGKGAIVGLHSNWIGDHFILACARPSDRIIKDHHLIHQFHSQNIGAVVNLQEPGEHAGCGDGVIPETGFAYNPDLFTRVNIAYFNFPWRGKEFMDENLALSICQIMDSRIAAGEKVAVHCHSGIGRTGLVIAFFLLYSGAYDAPMAAIQVVRKERPGTLRKKSQEQLVKRFDNYIRNLKVQFVPPEQRRKNLTHGKIKSYPTLVDSMVRQNELLYGMEQQALHYVPKMLDWLTRELIRRIDFDRAKREQIAMTFMKAFTTDLSLSPDDELVQRAKVRINIGDWSGVEELETSVLCHLLLEWLYQLQEPVVPDSILTTALGRGDIESSIDELSKCDQFSFASLQCLVCWMFQMVPVQPKLIRRLYSALAHVLLANTTLQNDRRSPYASPSAFDWSPEHDLSSTERLKTVRRHTMNKMYDVYTKYKPSLLEIEFGLLLEATARFWIKLGVARQEETYNTNKQTVNNSTVSSAPSSTMPSPLGTLSLKLRDKHRIGSFSQPWFRDRASLQYEQYNPESATKYMREMERGSIGGPSTSPTHFGEQKQKVEIQRGEQPLGTLLQEEKAKGKKKVVALQEIRKLESDEQKQNPIDYHLKMKVVIHEEQKKPIAHEGQKETLARQGQTEVVAHDEKKKLVGHEEKKKVVDHKVQKKVVPSEEKKKVVAHEVEKKPVPHDKTKRLLGPRPSIDSPIGHW